MRVVRLRETTSQNGELPRTRLVYRIRIQRVFEWHLAGLVCHMLNDIRYAIRTLRQNRGFALTAIISIGLAIGTNSSIFGFVDALLLRPLPVTRASDVVSLRQIDPTASASGLANLGGASSYPDFVYFKENNKSFVDLLAFRLVHAGIAPDARTQPQLRMGYVRPSLLVSLS